MNAPLENFTTEVEMLLHALTTYLARHTPPAPRTNPWNARAEAALKELRQT